MIRKEMHMQNILDEGGGEEASGTKVVHRSLSFITSMKAGNETHMFVIAMCTALSDCWQYRTSFVPVTTVLL